MLFEGGCPKTDMLKKVAVTTLSNTKNNLTTISDDTKKRLSKLVWRQQSIRALSAKGFNKVGHEFKNCGCSFFVDTCKKDISHSPKAVAINCGLRVCPECEARESDRKLKRYLPALQSLLHPNPDYPSHFLFKVTLTTPYLLNDLTSTSFKEKQRFVSEFFETFFYEYFLERGKLSKSEIRRQRCDLKKHGIGGICSAEFGERGHKLHWHLLVYAPFMPHDDVLRVWRAVTGGECKFARLNGIYAREGVELKDGGDIIGAVQEIVKYSTKFAELSPVDVPTLYAVLKGNRRFKSFGVLYNNENLANEELDHTCEECHSEREKLTVGRYVTLCQNLNIPISDEVADEVERGVALYFSREPEISSGKPIRKARDALESAST